MARNDDADRFVNCVINRGRYDSVTRTTLLMASMIIPTLFGIIIAFYASANHPDVFDPERDGYIAQAIISAAECGIVSFIMLFMSRRSKRHMCRDIEWMSSLCDYIDGIGGDSGEMRRIAKESNMIIAKINNGASMAIWAFTTLYICAVGILAYSNADLLDVHIMGFCIACYVLLIIQYIITAGSISRFPNKHDNLQCEFTDAMAKEMRRAGIFIEPMKRNTGNLHPVINTLLFIITFGLYSIVIILVSNIRFNNHVKGQWRYETKLMETLMKAHCASGVEGYDRPKSV